MPILAAPGVAPGLDARPVSLIDLAPTLAELAGLPQAPEWEGHSLLEPPRERTLYAFQTSFTEDLSTLAVIDGTRKLIGYQDPDAVRTGDLHAAFDLERDPAEVDDLLEREAWPRELLERERARLEELLTPLVTPEASVQTGETLRVLRAMGREHVHHVWVALRKPQLERLQQHEKAPQHGGEATAVEPRVAMATQNAQLQ